MPDDVETDAVAWFPAGGLPGDHELAPPGRCPRILEAWRSAYESGLTVTPLYDRPD